MTAKKIFFILLICSVNELCSGQNQDKISYKAIQRNDNTFVNYKDSLSKTVVIPLRVSQKIKEIIKKHYKSDFLKVFEKTSPIVFKIKYSNHIDIFVLKLSTMTDILYGLVAYDAFKDKLTENPPFIDGKWMENGESGFTKSNRLLNSPILFFNDIDGTGIKNIIVRERVHNGSFYNGVIEHIYSLNSRMAFNQVLCIEEINKYPPNDCLIHRFFKKNIIYSELICNGKKPIILGNVKVNLTDNPKVIHKQLYYAEYKNLLITGSGIKEESFLSNGYNLKY